MSETPRSSIDNRYERESEPVRPVSEPAPATPPYPAYPPSVSVGLTPAAPQVIYPAQGAAQTQPSVNVPAGYNIISGPAGLAGMMPAQQPALIVQQPVLGLPMGHVTVINNPPPAGAPCPVCGKPVGEAKADKAHHHAHAGPPAAPRFSKSTPEVFRDGFKPLWDAAQSEKAAFVVVSGCNKLLDVLLKELETKAKPLEKPTPAPSRWGGWSRPAPKKPTFAGRIENLQKVGLLLRSTVDASRDSGLSDVLTEKIDAAAVTSDMAKRYVQLLWQVADQGFEQPGWSQSGEFPKAVPAPAGEKPDHGPASPSAEPKTAPPPTAGTH